MPEDFTGEARLARARKIELDVFNAASRHPGFFLSTSSLSIIFLEFAMTFRGFLTEPTRQISSFYTYGMLIIFVVLFAWDIEYLLTLPSFYPHDPYEGLFLTLMLLFNHLAYQFRWPALIMASLRILAWSWIFITLFYVFFLSHVLYPN